MSIDFLKYYNKTHDKYENKIMKTNLKKIVFNIDKKVTNVSYDFVFVFLHVVLTF